MMAELLLSNHAYLAVYDDAAIVLDLDRDQYIGLNAQQVIALRNRVCGWPCTATTTPDQERALPSAADIDSLVQSLLARNLLTADERAGKVATPIAIAVAHIPAIDPDACAQPSISISETVCFMAAVCRARAKLRFRPLAGIVAGLLRRKQSQAQRLDHVRFARLQHLAAVFHTLRPLMYSHYNECLLDSLVLLEFLSSYGIFPTLVFGAKTDPFAAHAWVQEDDYVLTSAPWFVRGFKPILAI